MSGEPAPPPIPPGSSPAAPPAIEAIERFFFDGGGRVRLAWRLIVFVAALISLYVGVSVAVGVILVLAVAGAVGAEALDPEALIHEHFIAYMLLWSIPLTGTVFGLVWACRRFLDRADLASLGLGTPERRWLASPWAGIPFGALPILLVAGFLIAIGQLEASVSGSWIPALLLIPVFLVMAFLEEVACRGYLLRNLVESGRPVLAVAISSLVFTFFHTLNPEAWTSPANLLSIYLAGVFLAIACLHARNLWFPTALHFTWNYCQGAVLGIPVSGIPLDGLLRLERAEASADWLTGGEFGLEGSILTLALLAILTLYFAALLRGRGSEGPAAAPPGS